jgi:hypothetical protein
MCTYGDFSGLIFSQLVKMFFKVVKNMRFLVFLVAKFRKNYIFLYRFLACSNVKDA